MNTDFNDAHQDYLPSYLEEYRFCFEILYEILRNNVEKILSDPYHRGIEKISYDMESFLDLEERKKFLNASYKSNYPTMREDYKVYKGNGNLQIRNWRELFYFYLDDVSKEALLDLEELVYDELRLKAENPVQWYFYCEKETMQIHSLFEKHQDSFNFMNDFLTKWVEIYEKHQILSFIRKQLQVLDTHDINTEIDEIVIHLKDLFVDRLEYKRIIKLLVNNKIIRPNGDGYDILRIPGYENLKPKQLICSIGYKIQFGNLLRSTAKNTEVTSSLSKLFNISISKGNYDSFIRALDKPTKNARDCMRSTSFLNIKINY